MPSPLFRQAALDRLSGDKAEAYVFGTCYHTTLAKEDLETMLRLEADRFVTFEKEVTLKGGTEEVEVTLTKASAPPKPAEAPPAPKPAPKAPPTLLPLNVLLFTVSVPAFVTPAPKPPLGSPLATLLLIVLALIVRVPQLKIPAPEPSARPFRMVSFESATLALELEM